MNRLLNKTVMITGGLSGIGQACAFLAAKEGANVVVMDIPSQDSNTTMLSLKELNPKAVFIECDVADARKVQKAVKEVADNFGGIDIALNNAGIGGVAAKVGEMTENNWAQVIGVNLTGVFYCMRYELEQMAKQKQGIIINMASILGKVGFSSSAHYVAAKHGVLGLTKSAALEYADQGIRINAICPGFIHTPLLEKGGITEHSEIEKMIIKMHPMGRLGKADEIASGFVFLASDESSFMTGTSLEIDGGFLCQ